MKTLKQKFVSLFDGNFYEEEVNNFWHLPKKTYKGLYLVSIFEENYNGEYYDDLDYSLNIYVCYANELLVLSLDDNYDDDMVFKYKNINPEPENNKAYCHYIIHYLIKKILQDILNEEEQEEIQERRRREYEEQQEISYEDDLIRLQHKIDNLTESQHYRLWTAE